MGPFQDEAERLEHDSNEVYDMRMLKAVEDGDLSTNLGGEDRRRVGDEDKGKLGG